MNGVLKRKKDIKGEDPKKYLHLRIHYSRYQFIKSMYKLITSVFLQKSLEAQLRATDKVKAF